MQGLSGTYAVNSVNLLLQPTTHQWVDRELIGTDGNGRGVYPAVGDFELGWELMDNASFNQLVNAHKSTINTGTSVVDLPKWNDPLFTFYSYSGTYFQRPSYSGFFMEHYQGVRLIISNVRTD